MDLRLSDSLTGIAASQWNRLCGDGYPFTRHEFLRSLETSGCVGEQSGWQPCYLLAEADGSLIGALPLYLKSHSYGEYVFDWAWARAYAQHGLPYYPKFVVGIPFTPATGPRFLIAPEADRAAIVAHMLAHVRAFADARNLSSIHWLFTDASETALLEQHGYGRRVGCQFHWFNRGYRDFDDFLSTFSSAKRKNLRRERRQVREAGVSIEVRTGADVNALHWDAMYRFYSQTIRAHGAIAYLNRAFFTALGKMLGGQVVMVLARRNGDYIAGALNLRGRDTLYGRYWGALQPVSGLHFETCYYSAIEYCIREGLRRFEAGAQGAHKIARGFEPTATYSAHWLRHPDFAQAVNQFLAQERDDMNDYIDELSEHLPFRRQSGASR